MAMPVQAYYYAPGPQVHVPSNLEPHLLGGDLNLQPQQTQQNFNPLLGLGDFGYNGNSQTKLANGDGDMHYTGARMSRDLEMGQYHDPMSTCYRGMKDMDGIDMICFCTQCLPPDNSMASSSRGSMGHQAKGSLFSSDMSATSISPYSMRTKGSNTEEYSGRSHSSSASSSPKLMNKRQRRNSKISNSNSQNSLRNNSRNSNAGISKPTANTQSSRPEVLLDQLEVALQGDASTSADFKWKASQLFDQLKRLIENESSNRLLAVVPDDSRIMQTPLTRRKKGSRQSTKDTQPTDKMFHCTYASCQYSSNSAMDWRRHEETHWPQKRFMCLECSASSDEFSDATKCSFCTATLPPVGNIHAHYLQCESARRNGRTFARKDKLSEHLQKDHAFTPSAAMSRAATWTFEIDSGWPRPCGFCRQEFDVWDDRASHLIDQHFKQGAKISAWQGEDVDSSAEVGGTVRMDTSIFENGCLTGGPVATGESMPFLQSSFQAQFANFAYQPVNATMSSQDTVKQHQFTNMQQQLAPPPNMHLMSNFYASPEPWEAGTPEMQVPEGIVAPNHFFKAESSVQTPENVPRDYSLGTPRMGGYGSRSRALQPAFFTPSRAIRPSQPDIHPGYTREGLGASMMLSAAELAEVAAVETEEAAADAADAAEMSNLQSSRAAPAAPAQKSTATSTGMTGFRQRVHLSHTPVSQLSRSAPRSPSSHQPQASNQPPEVIYSPTVIQFPDTVQLPEITQVQESVPEPEHHGENYSYYTPSNFYPHYTDPTYVGPPGPPFANKQTEIEFYCWNEENRDSGQFSVQAPPVPWKPRVAIAENGPIIENMDKGSEGRPQARKRKSSFGKWLASVSSGSGSRPRVDRMKSDEVGMGGTRGLDLDLASEVDLPPRSQSVPNEETGLAVQNARRQSRSSMLGSLASAFSGLSLSRASTDESNSRSKAERKWYGKRRESKTGSNGVVSNVDAAKPAKDKIPVLDLKTGVWARDNVGSGGSQKLLSEAEIKRLSGGAVQTRS